MSDTSSVSIEIVPDLSPAPGWGLRQSQSLEREAPVAAGDTEEASASEGPQPSAAATLSPNRTRSFDRAPSGPQTPEEAVSRGSSVSGRANAVSGTPARSPPRVDSEAPQYGSSVGGASCSEGEEKEQPDVPGSPGDVSARASDKVRVTAAGETGQIGISWGPVEEPERRSTKSRWESNSGAPSRVTNHPRTTRPKSRYSAFELEDPARYPSQSLPFQSVQYPMESSRFSRRMDSTVLTDFGVKRLQKGHASRLLLLRFALAFRVVSAVALLAVGTFTFSRVRDSVTCTAAICYKGENVFSVGEGYTWADSMLIALEWQLLCPVLVLVTTIFFNSYITFAVIWNGSKENFAREEKATTICCLISTCCLAVLVAPLFLVMHGFCNFNSYDWTYLYAEPAMPAVSAGQMLCDQKGLIMVTVGVAAAAVLSELCLFVRGYTRFFEATLILGYLKFAAGATVLSMATLVVRDSTQYDNAVRDIRNALLRNAAEEQHESHVGPLTNVDRHGFLIPINISETVEESMPNVEILPVAVSSQYSLFFDTTLSALYILGFVNVGCGLYGCFAAWNRCQVLATINVLINFVFFVVNAVGVGGMLFGAQQLNFICNYSDYPVRQLDYDIYLSRLVCQSRATYLTSWAILAIAVLIFFVDFVVSAWGFIQNYCRKDPGGSSQKRPVTGKAD
ncbi:conserved hypothetical protein [Neospora caninum Liverpool]|uniref:Transmembrane protein n=1 Tax=Neospora caninum (strain Liverpool) TaxID=572307 RepID=F0VD62_NEOCL|nr:conserved hypothetical protein [Neospora caninum Liverpool]CBZ51577.1 conserved hypothetical protein [Neospora caninum Liverpool]CEL65527.1 TPA: hypothetical protein BN1204_013710 [Neospora caninum Liverpool]|eukprot:XP_003881610.1 conserved hypothetical protein [Neospora caninum Liverpool]